MNFIQSEFVNWHLQGEVIFVKGTEDDTTMKRVRMQKKMCDELNPNTGKVAYTYHYYEWLDVETIAIENKSSEENNYATQDEWVNAMKHWGYVRKEQTATTQA